MPETIPEIAVPRALELLKERLLDAMGGDLLRIVFFGSRSLGRFRDDSDIDVLVGIKEKSPQLKEMIHSIADEIEKEILLYRIPFSLHIFGHEEYRTFKEKRSPFLEEIGKRGEILYEKIPVSRPCS